MKRIIILLVVLLCLAGCTPSTSPEPQNNNPDPPVTNVSEEDKGLSQQELFTALAAEGRLFGPEWYIIDFYKDGSCGTGIYGSGYYQSGPVKDFEYLKDNRYKFTIAVPAFEGNEMTDPYDAYDYPLEIVYEPAKKSIIHAKGPEYNGYFTARMFSEKMEVELSEPLEYFYIDSHFYARLYGEYAGASGEYQYFMNLFIDEDQIDSGIFSEKAKTRVIYSGNMAAKLSGVRIFDYLIIRSQIGKQINGNWVEIFNVRTGEIVMTFEDVDFQENFYYEGGVFDFYVSKYKDINDDPQPDHYTITLYGIYKLNS